MDEAILGGLEDWDFWLRCANAGFWGGTVQEFLDWYRRRPSHNDRWPTWDKGERQAAFCEQIQLRYPRLFEGAFPEPARSWPVHYAELPPMPWFVNRLGRTDGTRRLLILVPHMVIGGSDKYVLDLMSELIPKHGYEVTIAATRNSDYPWRHCFEAQTPDVFTLDAFLRLCDYPRFLVYLIRSRGIDSVLVTHSELGYRLLPYLRAQCPGIRCYDYVHIEDPGWKAGGYPTLSIAYAPFLNRTAASSRRLKEWMAGRGGRAESISVVTTNIDAEAWRRDRYDRAALREKWDIPDDVPVILFAARLVPQKQPEVLAQTLKNLHQRGLRFLCLIAGDGERGAWLRDFVRDHAIDGARMLGCRSLEEIRELLAVSDIFFLPSRHEGIALTLFEAMAMEVVPVGADVGGQAELVTPDCGALIAPGGDEAPRYADVIERLLSEPAARAAMAAAARRRVSDCFRLERMGREMAALLRGDRDGRAVFDLSGAAQAFLCTHAREVIEQYRLEIFTEALEEAKTWHKQQTAQWKAHAEALQAERKSRTGGTGPISASRRPGSKRWRKPRTGRSGRPRSGKPTRKRCKPHWHPGKSRSCGCGRPRNHCWPGGASDGRIERLDRRTCGRPRSRGFGPRFARSRVCALEFQYSCASNTSKPVASHIARMHDGVGSHHQAPKSESCHSTGRLMP